LFPEIGAVLPPHHKAMAYQLGGPRLLKLKEVSYCLVLANTGLIFMSFLAFNFTRILSKGYTYDDSSDHTSSLLDSSPTYVQTFANLALICNIIGLGGPYMFLHRLWILEQKGESMSSDDRGFLALTRHMWCLPTSILLLIATVGSFAFELEGGKVQVLVLLVALGVISCSAQLAFQFRFI